MKLACLRKARNMSYAYVCCLGDKFILVSELVRVLLMMLGSLTLWYWVILLAAAD